MLDFFVSLGDNSAMNEVYYGNRKRAYFDPGSQFVVARYVYSDRTNMGLHGHDYAEVCWITQGKCRHITTDREEKLVAGDIRFVRPPDVHRFKSIGPKPMHLTNIAFPEDILARSEHASAPSIMHSASFANRSAGTHVKWKRRLRKHNLQSCIQLT